MRRKELYEVYKRMTNIEKVKWAEACNYASVNGLRKYLSSEKQTISTKVETALFDVVNSRAKELGVDTRTTQDKVMNTLYDYMASCEDINEIKDIRIRLGMACDIAIAGQTKLNNL